MRAIRTLTAVLAILIALFFSTGNTLAAVPTDECYLYTISTTQGPAGTIVSVAGDSSYIGESYSTEVLWDGTASLATMPLDSSGRYSGTFAVPANAATGEHNVIMRVPAQIPAPPGYGFQECPFTFTVIAATGAGGVQPDAYTSSGSTLPGTGFAALLPLAGLAAASAGALIARNRRRHANRPTAEDEF